MSRTVRLRSLPSMFVALFYMGVNMAEANLGYFLMWTVLAIMFFAIAMIVDSSTRMDSHD